jgi:hypothetical protein
MDTININGFKLNLDFETKISKNGKEIRLSGIAKNCQVPEKYINEQKKYKHHWIYTFRYIGTEKFVSFEFDHYDKFVGII